MHIGYASQSPNSHFWLIVGHGVETRAEELGVKLTLLAGSTLDQQIEAINTLIDQHVDVLLIGPSRATGLAPQVARARSAGIPVVVLAAELQDCQVDATVRVDHHHGAELVAAYAIEQIGGHGAVAQIMGPRWLQDNLDRAEGVRHIFSQHPDVELVFEQESPDWQPSSGAALMQAALEQFPHVRAVCVANDTLAIGAVQAIAAAGRTGQIVVTGFDATPEALIAINEGRMTATINQPIRAIGRTGVELAYRLAAGESVPSLVLKDVSLVTRDSLTETALEIVSVLPGVLQDAIERGEALAQARQQIILSQQAALRELSTPLIPVSDEVLIMPLIGMIDALRAQQILETLLQGVAERRAKTVIMDITGVQIVDTHVANALIQAAQAVRLLGAVVVLTGIRPEVAQTLVGLGVDLRTIVTYSSLQSGIANTLRRT
ncbi:MAG TPA: substrate-binding domain-containing protein [Herpetosiphonaceae bacterium]